MARKTVPLPRFPGLDRSLLTSDMSLNKCLQIRRRERERERAPSPAAATPALTSQAQGHAAGAVAAAPPTHPERRRPSASCTRPAPHQPRSVPQSPTPLAAEASAQTSSAARRPDSPLPRNTQPRAARPRGLPPHGACVGLQGDVLRTRRPVPLGDGAAVEPGPRRVGGAAWTPGQAGEAPGRAWDASLG